jgi:hypothetical protein
MAFATGGGNGAELAGSFDLYDAFAETGSFVVETSDPAGLEACAKRHGATVTRLGTTLAEPVLCWNDQRATIAGLREAWSAPLRDFYADALAETSG